MADFYDNQFNRLIMEDCVLLLEFWLKSLNFALHQTEIKLFFFKHCPP